MDELVNTNSLTTNTTYVGGWSSTGIISSYPNYVSTTYITSAYDNSEISKLKADIAELQSKISKLSKQALPVGELTQSEHRKLGLP